jgi:hypothetical protein
LGVRMSRFDVKEGTTSEEKLAGIAKVRAGCEMNQRGCWIWNGFKNKLGYGAKSFQGKPWMAHRLMWALTRSAIPQGMFVCHTCDTPSCCNPDHLFLGDHKTNQRDMIYKSRHAKGGKTHCLRGHEFTPENTLVTLNECGGQRRSCKLCHRRRLRIKAGWPVDLAESLEAVPHGHGPVGAKWPRKKQRKRSSSISAPADTL